MTFECGQWGSFVTLLRPSFGVRSSAEEGAQAAARVGRKDLASIIARKQRQITAAGLVPTGLWRLRRIARLLRSSRPGAVMLDTEGYRGTERYAARRALNPQLAPLAIGALRSLPQAAERKLMTCWACGGLRGASCAAASGAITSQS